MVENGLDVGFAFDGDADRCLCVDEKGNVVTGDHILYIYGCYMKERGNLMNNTVVTTVMSNFGLYKAFDEQGITPFPGEMKSWTGSAAIRCLSLTISAWSAARNMHWSRFITSSTAVTAAGNR